MITKIVAESKKKKKISKHAKKQIKDLMLDRPFTTGGWPGGEDRGWLPDSDPVNKQIADYFLDLGLIVNERDKCS